MKKTKKHCIFVYTLILFSLGCSVNKNLTLLTWKQGQDLTVLQPLNKIDKSSLKELRSSKEFISLQKQTYNSAEVDNSFIKTVYDKNKQKFSIVASYSDDKTKFEKLPFAEFEKQRPTLIQELKARIPAFRKFKSLSPSLYIVKKNNFYELLWKVSYFDSYGIPWEISLNNHYQVRSVNRVGSQFHNTLALIYPLGPKISPLQEVLLTNLSLSPSISNSFVSVQSQASNQITDITEPLKFNPNDTRFEQVQVFYFITESLKWFESKLLFQLPTSLQVEVQVGAPEKTNTAFYYQGKIRIGSGDNISYQNIPLDPTIVIHESVHAVVESIARLPYDGEGGSLNEAFADYFTALQLDNPNMGEVAWMKGPFRRTINNSKKLSDRTGALYGDSAIISGLLWELKTKFGSEKGRDLGMLTLNRLNPLSNFEEFGIALREVVGLISLTNEQQVEALEIIKARGF